MSWRKKALFAAIVTAAFFVVVELGLAAFGYPPIFEREDPYLGFAGGAPLFVPGPAAPTSGGEVSFVTAANKLRYFNAQRFVSPKPPGSTRIFCMGGSSVHGHPYDHATSFCGWLSEFLPVADPSRHWEVINAGGISYASYRVARLMDELAAHDPDLFIVYTAHNEFLEWRTYPDPPARPLLGRLEAELTRTRTFSLFADTLRPEGDASSRHAMTGEVATQLDGAVGPTAYTRDDALRERVLVHYRANLERMIAIARSAGADVLLATPAANLAGMSPFKSEPSPGLQAGEVEQVERAVRRLREAAASRQFDDVIAACRDALVIDPRRAELQYRCAGWMRRVGDLAGAREAYWRAVDEDVCPLRALSGMRDQVLDAARSAGVPVVDFGALAERLSPDGLPDEALFLDHVHPGIELHRAFSLAILDVMAAEGWVEIASDWDDAAIDRISARVHGRIDVRAHGIALRNLAIVLGYTGKAAEADRVALAAVVQVPEDGQAQYLAGLAHARAGDFAAATRRLRRAQALAPRDPEIVSALGLVLLQQGRLDAAGTEFRRAIALAPRHARAYLQLGQVLALQGRTQGAARQYARALELDPGNTEVAQGLAALRGASGTAIPSGRPLLPAP